MKTELQRYLKSLRVYTPYQSFVVYFVPVFSVTMLGYYFDNAAIQQIFSYSAGFTLLTKMLIYLLVGTFLGRYFSDLTAYVLAGIRFMLFWLGLLTYKLTKWLKKFPLIQRLRRALQQNLAKEEPTFNELQTKEILEKNEIISNWFLRIQMSTLALQTTFGTLLAMALLSYSLFKAPTILVLLILLAFTNSSQKHLHHAKEVVNSYPKE